MKTKILIPLIAGLGLLCACKGKSGYEVINNKVENNSEADSLKDSSLTPKLKLIKSASMRFKVKNVQHATEQITALTNGAQGMVINNRTESSPERSFDVTLSDDSILRVTSFNTEANLIVKIPSEKLDGYLDQIARLGLYVNSKSIDIENKSEDYLAAQLKLKTRIELVNQQKTGRIVIKDPADVLLLKDEMVAQKIENQKIDEAIKHSIIHLSFYQSNTINKEVIANDNPSAYSLPFFKRLGLAVGKGWSIFVDVFMFIANLWVFLLAGLGAWLIIRRFKNKKPAVTN